MSLSGEDADSQDLRMAGGSDDELNNLLGVYEHYKQKLSRAMRAVPEEEIEKRAWALAMN